VQLVDAVNRFTTKSYDYVSFLKPGFSRGASLIRGHDEDAVLIRKMVEPRDLTPQLNVLTSESDITPTDSAISYQSASDEFRRIHGYREAEALRSQNRGGINADHFPSRIYKRTSGIPRVKRRIGLNNIVDQSSRT